MQMFGWYPFGKPIVLPESSDEDEDSGPREGGRRTRPLMNAINDSDAALLWSCDIVPRITEEEQRKKNSELMRANFEPDVTNEDLEREERELAEQEEAVAVYALSFPPVPPTPLVEPPADPGPEARLFRTRNLCKREGRYQHHLSQTTKLSSPTTRLRIFLPNPTPYAPLPILSRKAILLDPSSGNIPLPNRNLMEFREGWMIWSRDHRQLALHRRTSTTIKGSTFLRLLSTLTRPQSQQQPAYQEFDGIPGGLNSRHTRSRAGSVMDLATQPRRPVPQRSHTSSIDSVGMGMGARAKAGSPSPEFGSSIGRQRAGSWAKALDSGAAAVILGRNTE